MCSAAENQASGNTFVGNTPKEGIYQEKCFFLMGKNPSEGLVHSSTDEIDSSFGDTIKFKVD